jgi:hypothetical protein
MGHLIAAPTPEIGSKAWASSILWQQSLWLEQTLESLWLEQTLAAARRDDNIDWIMTKRRRDGFTHDEARQSRRILVRSGG